MAEIDLCFHCCLSYDDKRFVAAIFFAMAQSVKFNLLILCDLIITDLGEAPIQAP